jgi:hypothetical protein
MLLALSSFVAALCDEHAGMPSGQLERLGMFERFSSIRTMLMQFAQYLGWLLTLAIVMLTVSRIVKALLTLIWSEASEFRHVSSDDALRAMLRAFGDQLGLLYKRKLATVCSVATLLTLLFKGVDGYASFGFSAITFVIVGLATPSAIRSVRSFALAFVIRRTRKS